MIRIVTLGINLSDAPTRRRPILMGKFAHIVRLIIYIYICVCVCVIGCGSVCGVVVTHVYEQILVVLASGSMIQFRGIHILNADT